MSPFFNELLPTKWEAVHRHPRIVDYSPSRFGSPRSLPQHEISVGLLAMRLICALQAKARRPDGGAERLAVGPPVAAFRWGVGRYELRAICHRSTSPTNATVAPDCGRSRNATVAPTRARSIRPSGGPLCASGRSRYEAANAQKSTAKRTFLLGHETSEECAMTDRFARKLRTGPSDPEQPSGGRDLIWITALFDRATRFVRVQALCERSIDDRRPKNSAIRVPTSGWSARMAGEDEEPTSAAAADSRGDRVDPGSRRAGAHHQSTGTA